MEDLPSRITAKCPIRTTLELVGGKWKLLLLFQLRTGPMRLSQLKARIPEISEKMLIQELKHLVISELVSRNNFGEVPPRVEYALTPMGRECLPLISEMKRFSQTYTTRTVPQAPGDQQAGQEPVLPAAGEKF